MMSKGHLHIYICLIDEQYWEAEGIKFSPKTRIQKRLWGVHMVWKNLPIRQDPDMQPHA